MCNLRILTGARCADQITLILHLFVCLFVCRRLRSGRTLYLNSRRNRYKKLCLRYRSLQYPILLAKRAFLCFSTSSQQCQMLRHSAHHHHLLLLLMMPLPLPLLRLPLRLQLRRQLHPQLQRLHLIQSQHCHQGTTTPP